MPKQNNLQEVFDRLKKIFTPYEKSMDVSRDTDEWYLLNTRHLLKKNYPLAFGGVHLGKNYVSVHILSFYYTPAQTKAISPELKKRMQGKACFNFKQVDEKLFKELAAITKAGAKRFNDKKFIDEMRKLHSKR